MATTKKDKSRANKAEKFKEQAKKKAVQDSTLKTHLVPQTEWQSADMLDMRGDFAEGFEVELVKAYEALSRAGQIFSQFISMNLAAGKAKMTYLWNNGEVATDKEVKEYSEAMQFIQQQRQIEIDKLKNKLEGEQAANQTGLITPGGEILTLDNLEKEKGGIVTL